MTGISKLSTISTPAANQSLTLSVTESPAGSLFSANRPSLDRLKFAEPSALWVLALAPVLAALWFASAGSAKTRVSKMVAQRLRELLVGQAQWRGLRTSLLIAGLALAALALARPQLGEILQERKGRGRDVIIAVDVSRSMLAGDLPPSRLKRAQMAAEDLVRQLKGDRVGLVAFAGSSFLQAPVTADHAAVLTAMQELGPELGFADPLRSAEDRKRRTEGGEDERPTGTHRTAALTVKATFWTPALRTKSRTSIMRPCGVSASPAM
jgi:hypothetical protein